jgi:hypothetical protein
MSVFEPRCRKEKVEGFAKARLPYLSVAYEDGFEDRVC